MSVDIDGEQRRTARRLTAEALEEAGESSA
jgi:hypothetical protein